MTAFSVLVLTLNEERNLSQCLASTQPCDDLVVLDSGSTDRTVELARAAGARVFTRQFDTFAGQRNFAQREIPFRHQWIFHLDADERLTPELIAEIRAAAAAAGDRIDGFLVAPKMLWRGKWLPRCTDFPAYQTRFVRKHFVFVDAGHGQREAPAMRVARLNENYLHELFPGSEEAWLDKHRRYARQEAEHTLATPLPPVRQLIIGQRLERRRALKSYAARLPARPFARFVYQYFLRGGFLDGMAALRYCYLLARYEAFTVRELRALRRKRMLHA